MHECFIPPAFIVEKYGITPSEAVFVGTQGHTAAQAFGKIMSLTEPKHAVCYHFQNDHDTAPAVEHAIRETYDGPLDLALDFMTWNVTKDGVRTRMAVPNHESYPAPPQRTKEPPDSMKAYKWTEFSLSGLSQKAPRLPTRSSKSSTKSRNRRQTLSDRHSVSGQKEEIVGERPCEECPYG